MPRRPRRAFWSFAAAASLLVACQAAQAPESAPPAARRAQERPSSPAPQSPQPEPAALPASPAGAAHPGRPVADTESPSVPSRLAATSRSPSEIALGWEASSDGVGVAGYEVYRGEALVAKVATPGAVDSGLRPGVRACYSVRAFDAAGNFSARTPPSCTETLDTAAPTEPPKLTVTPRPGGQAAVAWGASTDDGGVTGYEVWRGTQRVAAQKETVFIDPGLQPAVEHCYTVRAFDRAGNRSSAAGPACATIPDTTPPSIPTDLALQAPGEHEVALTWGGSKDDVGVARYEISRTGASGAAPPVAAAEGTSARDQGLTASTRYCYAVRACDAAGNCSALSPEACVTTPDLTPPSAPATLTASAVSDNEVELRWSPSTDNVGVAGYDVFRAGQAVAPARQEPSLRDHGLRPAVQYCYTVQAFDAAGNRSPPSRATCAVTPDLTPPTVPGRPAAVSVSSSQVFIAWDPSTDDVAVAGYEVLRGSSVVARVSATRARELQLEANQAYCYSVLAFDAAGNRSDPTAPACATTADPSQLASPSDLRVVRMSATNVLLQWEPSEVSGVLYRVYADGNKSVGLTRGNTFTPSGRVGGEPSCCRVAAVDGQGRESPRSNEVCAKTPRGPLSQR